MDKFSKISDIRWANPDHTILSFRIKFNHLTSEVDYLLCSTDITSFAKDLWPRLTSGEFGHITEFSKYYGRVDTVVIGSSLPMHTK